MVTLSSSFRKVFVPNQLIKMTASVPVIHHNVESVLNVLELPENKEIAAVQELLKIYEATKISKEKNDACGEVKKHPLIIFEGLDGSGKSTVSFKFAKKIDGVKWQTPPKSIQHLRIICDRNKKLNAAYYSLGNYIAGLEVQKILKNRPVVMDRYWHSTAAFGIAQAVNDNPDFSMPPQGDKMYCWPEDLFKPDIVIFLDVDENVRLQRISRRKEFTPQEDLLSSSEEFRNNVILAYRNMCDPEVIFIDGNHTIESECSEILKRVKHLLCTE
ncbi:UMP-CMP kinase 2, mitochondrial-like [Diorhabda carinulata]|uniref:UMP-CMP kinase 2, mitochondrial-like n=1 Tax=Diorhabda carinulata TaxID=1163345 RepID=UPI0025A03AD4|nr:UMP-CMP kinase 2, mitochondrial-like [Diorhabda carinulata]